MRKLRQRIEDRAEKRGDGGNENSSSKKWAPYVLFPLASETIGEFALLTELVRF
jgi:hypothetical protein